MTLMNWALTHTRCGCQPSPAQQHAGPVNWWFSCGAALYFEEAARALAQVSRPGAHVFLFAGSVASVFIFTFLCVCCYALCVVMRAVSAPLLSKESVIVVATSIFILLCLSQARRSCWIFTQNLTLLMSLSWCVCPVRAQELNRLEPNRTSKKWR